MNDLEGGLKMGSRGAFLEKGFKYQKWTSVGYTLEGIKILEPINKNESWSLPERSNTPGTSYILYSKNGEFSNYREYNSKREAVFEIDFHYEHGKKEIHVHEWINGERQKRRPITTQEKQKYKNLFKGVKV